MKRYITDFIEKDLNEKMVFVGGPRQVGKTTLALNWIGDGSPTHPAYLNWDSPPMRQQLLRGILPANETRIIFDEIHKYKGWRNLVKGFYDINKSNIQFLVTGSARLDYYRKGGDSLQGRYHYYRLHPLTLSEIIQSASQLATDSDVDQLMQFGGFPEPFLKGDKRHWNRWQKERSARVFRDDLTSLENVKDISQLELLSELLIPRIGSLLSINSLREDLHCSHDAVSRWLTILENLYVIYRLKPYGASTIKALQKEAKLFFWDWSLSTSKGACFENMMAGHLLKYCHLKNDSEGSNLELMYLRDKEKREVDFVVVHKTTPLFAVECKTGAKQISPHIKYFAERTNIPKFYQVHLGKEHFVHNETRTEVVPFVKFCCDLGL